MCVCVCGGGGGGGGGGGSVHCYTGGREGREGGGDYDASTEPMIVPRCKDHAIVVSLNGCFEHTTRCRIWNKCSWVDVQ